MIKVEVKIELYRLNELPKESRELAINSMATSLFYEDVKEYENYTIKELEEYVIEVIELNDYLYFKDGTMANTLTYVDGHPKTGISEFTFNNEVYDITKQIKEEQ